MKELLTKLQTRIHARAIEASRRLRQVEWEMGQVLKEVDAIQFYKNLNRHSLFQYAVIDLGLSEATAYAFISVARKCIQHLSLDQAIKSQSLSVSKAVRFVSILSEQNMEHLIVFAQNHSSKQVDREVARLNPKPVKPDRMKPLSEEFAEVTLRLTKAAQEKLRRAQVLEGSVELGVIFEKALTCYLEKRDPVEKAKRAQERKQKTLTSHEQNKDKHRQFRQTHESELCSSRKQRKALTAQQRHQVFNRDEGKCTHVDASGVRCNSERWVEVHHLCPVSRGGDNEVSNLTTLCSFHHDLVHQLSLPIEGGFSWLRSPQVVYRA